MENKIKSRNPFLAFLFSLFVPGLGQLYNGKWKKAILFPVGLLIFAIIINLGGLKSNVYAYGSSLILMISAVFFIAIDAAKTAHRNENYQLRFYNQWYFYLLAVLSLCYVVSSFSENITKISRLNVFKIGSQSGVPNLLPGDYVLGDFKIYDSQNPTYGDLVIFSINDRDSYVYRVVGMPNDTINIKNQSVMYRNKKYASQFISISKQGEFEMEEFLETLPNGLNYRIYKNKMLSASNDGMSNNIIIPEDSYFLLGDNRSFSMDSRFIGFVKREQIKGKLLSIFYSKDFKKINKKLE